MRRFVSIVILLLCSLGPLNALLPGSEESQLPACCRRHGMHHCMMALAEQAGNGHVVSAPSRCPQYHRGSVARVGVYTPSTGIGVAQPIESAGIPAESQTVTLRRAWTEGNRGPPTLL
ncbi:hypothetical protein [Occallatibacter riparius]|uniref:Uncharacterized protein n=1 Tax=Occallatibacter riparius TaxID=1002689 RepID=A0A9J7BMN0_9BACT|nr:hypothetical protein [Occallatibacter riparius]UWZ83753.1 hypothetical protein MOP44_24715 [Occallatibacter riparius]